MIRRSEDRAALDLMRPLLHTSRIFYIFGGILLILAAWFLYAWITQISQGLGVTAMRTPVGAAWGVYIVNFVFFVGIAHGGIAVAAAIRLLNLNSYKPIARIGEVLTVVSLMMAGISIVCDMGRPEKIFNMVLFWPQRVGWSPLSWDITVIFLYFILSVSYLWLTMRKDLFLFIRRFSKRAWLYRFLLIGYRDDEGEKVDSMARWLSAAIIFLIVMLSGGVIPWIFGLLPSRPGWFGALAGPYFLTASIASAIAAVILTAIVLRRIFKWQTYIKPEILRGLGVFLGIITLFYLYLMLSEQLTMRYAAPASELSISDMLLQGEFAPIFWSMITLGFFVPAMMLIVQAIRPKWFGITRTLIAVLAIIIGFWIKRFFIVVPSLLRPLLPFQGGSYNPSWVEWSLIAGTIAITVLLYMIFLKIFPIMEMPEE